MRSKLASEADGRTFVLVLDQGEEAFAAVTAFANDKAISAAVCPPVETAAVPFRHTKPVSCSPLSNLRGESAAPSVIRP